MMTAALLLTVLLTSPGQETGSPGQNVPRDPNKIPVEKPKEDPKPVGTRTYTDRNLGIAFDYPANWQFQKKDRNRPDRFVIPLENTSAKGELQVIDLEYRAAPEAFQETQATMIGRLNQQLIRQWQIEVLGVPLLMTKLKSTSDSGERMTLVGLLYASTPRKFNFRLSAPSENFEAVEYPWQGVLETLRTTTGALPTVEGIEPPKTVPTPVKEARTEIGPRLKDVTFRGPVVATMAFGGTSGTVYLPKGWTTEPGGEGALRLSHPKLTSPLIARGYLTQADNPSGVLTRAAAESLKEFAKIERRYDRDFTSTKTGASAAAVFRIGATSDNRARAIYEAYVYQESLFVMLRGEGTTALRAKTEMAVIEELMTAMRLEPKPTVGG